MLLVDDDQTQVAETRIGMQQPLGRDHDVDGAAFEPLEYGRGLAVRAKARQGLDAHRPVGEAVAEALQMLLRQQRGTGSVNFGSSGVSFETGGQQNDNTAFYTFTGAQLQNIFNVSQGQINFNLTSSYNLAARLLLPQYSYRDVFDGFDN